MRLLSFLTDIERAIRLEANASETEIWRATRMVNFQTGLGRLILGSLDADSGMPQGAIIVQHFSLANGSFCLKASLEWQGSRSATILNVYDTPLLNWRGEANRIASAWLAGPTAETASMAAAHEEEAVAIAS